MKFMDPDNDIPLETHESANASKLSFADFWPGLVLTGFALAIFWPILLHTQTVFDVDRRTHQAPMRDFIFGQLWSGELPLWWPELRCGYPIHAYGEGGLFYPPNAIFRGLFGGVWGDDLLLFAHLLLLSFGAYCLAREMGLSKTGACYVGLVIGFGGCSKFWGWSNAMASQCWVIWGIWALFRAKLDRRWIAGAAVFWALAILAGRFQRCYLLMIWGVLLSLVYCKNKAELKRQFIHLIVVYSLAILIASVQILPTLELLSLSDRSEGLSYMQSRGMSFNSKAWRYLLFGYGTEIEGPRREYMAYPGLISWLGVATGLYFVWKLRDLKSLRFLGILVIGGMGLWIAFGEKSVAYVFLRSYAPFFSQFRVPARMLIWTQFCLALLSGLSLTWLEQRFQHKKKQIATLILLILIADLYCFHERMSQLTSLKVYQASPTKIKNALNPTIDRITPSFRIFALDIEAIKGEELPKDIEKATITINNNEYFAKNMGAAYGFAQFDGYGALRLRRQLNYCQPQNSSTKQLIDRFIRASGKAIISTKSIIHKDLKRVKISNDCSVYEVKAAKQVPFARFVKNVVITQTQKEAIRQLDNISPEQNIIEAPQGIDPPQADATAKVQVVDRSQRLIRIRYSAKSPQIMVINQSYYPGWKATVNGKSVAIYPADLMFQAVKVPAGDHTLTLNFAPPVFKLSAIMSVIGLFLTTALVIRIHKQRPGQTGEPTTAVHQSS